MIWLIGNRGMLGDAVERMLQADGLPYIASDNEVDITDTQALRSFAQDKPVDWIINCAAYTNVDGAEDEAGLAGRINAEGVGNIAVVAREHEATVVHFSTDYVFNGRKSGEYLEEDATDPLSVYGSSKLGGEQLLAREWRKHFIIRISWLFGVRGKNFVYTMLRLFGERDELTVVDDQWGSPTYTEDVAALIRVLLSSGTDRYGVYHFTNEGVTNWHSFASAILAKATALGLVRRNVLIRPVPSAQYKTRAIRPGNSRMSKNKIRTLLHHEIPSWENALDRFLATVVQNTH